MFFYVVVATNGDEKSSNRRSRSFEYLDVRETGADSEFS